MTYFIQNALRPEMKMAVEGFNADAILATYLASGEWTMVPQTYFDQFQTAPDGSQQAITQVVDAPDSVIDAVAAQTGVASSDVREFIYSEGAITAPWEPGPTALPEDTAPFGFGMKTGFGGPEAVLTVHDGPPLMQAGMGWMGYALIGGLLYMLVKR